MEHPKREVTDSLGEVWYLNPSSHYNGKVKITFLYDFNEQEIARELYNSKHDWIHVGFMEVQRLEVVERFEGVEVRYDKADGIKGLSQVHIHCSSYEQVKLVRELVTIGRIITDMEEFLPVANAIWNNNQPVLIDFKIYKYVQLPTRQQVNMTSELLKAIYKKTSKMQSVSTVAPAINFAIVPQQAEVSATLEIYFAQALDLIFVWNELANEFWRTEPLPTSLYF